MLSNWHASCSLESPGGEEGMRALAIAGVARRGDRTGFEVKVEHPTLYELVEAVSEVANDDREVVAVVQHLLESGRVRRACAVLPRHGGS
jgi:hypothetical protein